ncbi:hypothetical protein PINS_up008360 [Pythium insidiosum]|nr:hypothetical protein PINS_up008360 [Pythium insidiosum]
MMERCQQIWTELGLNAEDQAGKFRDINELLMRKCSEELEGLEAARTKLRDRIQHVYDDVKRLEAVLCVESPVDIALLNATAGTSLLQQERALVELRAKLQDEFVSRFTARCQGLESIHALMEELNISSVAHFRYFRQDTSVSLLEGIMSNLVLANSWKKTSCSSDAVLELISSDNRLASVAVSDTSLRDDAEFLGLLLREKAKRLAEMEEHLSKIRSLVFEMELSEEELVSILERLSVRAPSTATESSAKLTELVHRIMRKVGQLDVSLDTLDSIQRLRDVATEIYDGRSNAVSFLHSTLEEAASVAHASLSSSGLEHLFPSGQLRTNQAGDDQNVLRCCRRALEQGQDKLAMLTGPINQAIRALLFSMNDEFSAFGIETDRQRVSFLLGSDDHIDHPARLVLEKYMGEAKSHASDHPQMANNSFLSEFDPAIQELGYIYSASYGTSQLTNLKSAATDMNLIRSKLESAQKRLESLNKIMRLFNEINEFKKKISEFEQNASQKDRLFGSSLRLLEEERFRKMAAKRYPSLLAALRKEVEKWVQNEGGEFNLSILGQEMKALLVEMMNTDTGLMHLDLGVLDTSRPTSRKAKPGVSSVLPPPAPSTPNQAAPPRSRPSSAARSRDASTRK